MKDEILQIRNTVKPSIIAKQAIRAVVDGNTDPLTVWMNLQRFKVAIKYFESDNRVFDAVSKELSKYGESQRFGDCVLTEREAGVQYDFSQCGDPYLKELYQQAEEIKANIKSRELFLKGIPPVGIEYVDERTGEVCTIYPPVKTSKTIIQTTFDK